MHELQAACGNCGNVFGVGLALEQVRNWTFVDCKAQCPRCREMAVIPDGVYSEVGSALEILIGVGDAQASLDALNRMRAKLESQPAQRTRVLFSELGDNVAEALDKVAPKDPARLRLWQAALLGALAFAWEKAPAGALKWIELVEKAQELFGFDASRDRPHNG